MDPPVSSPAVAVAAAAAAAAAPAADVVRRSAGSKAGSKRKRSRERELKPRSALRIASQEPLHSRLVAAEDALAQNAANNAPDEKAAKLVIPDWRAYEPKSVPKAEMLALGQRLEKPFDLGKSRSGVRRCIDLITWWLMTHCDGGMRYGNLLSVSHVARAYTSTHWKKLQGIDKLICARGMYLRAKGIRLPVQLKDIYA